MRPTRNPFWRKGFPKRRRSINPRGQVWKESVLNGTCGFDEQTPRGPLKTNAASDSPKQENLRGRLSVQPALRLHRNYRITREVFIGHLEIGHESSRRVLAQRIVQRCSCNRIEMPPKGFRIGTLLERQIDDAFSQHGHENWPVFNCIASLACHLVGSLVSADAHGGRSEERRVGKEC